MPKAKRSLQDRLNKIVEDFGNEHKKSHADSIICVGEVKVARAFHNGREDVHQKRVADRLQLASDDMHVNAARALLEEHHYWTCTELAREVGIAPSMILHILKKLKDEKNLRLCAVSSTQKFLVQQHITTSKHQANKQLNSKQRQLFLTQPTTSNVRSEFNIDLCRSLISADIPLYKLKNKVFREFLEKYTQHTIPDESTLRKTYAPSIYDETIQKIRDEIKDSSIWVSIDETPDKEVGYDGGTYAQLGNLQPSLLLVASSQSALLGATDRTSQNEDLHISGVDMLGLATLSREKDNEEMNKEKDEVNKEEKNEERDMKEKREKNEEGGKKRGK
ncbi:hypothetical protein ANN_08545 [Periplaneta americana]|uniref:Uncharacterized protein n=1 Tax=Periplaneta americana TaxID=6978 RepID=A0ABQ8T2X0_PERAM|nr:hypothetical protein ANN_08545 [Periplaneta americana]